MTGVCQLEITRGSVCISDRTLLIKLLSGSVQTETPIYDRRASVGGTPAASVASFVYLMEQPYSFTSIFKFQEAKLAFHRRGDVTGGEFCFAIGNHVASSQKLYVQLQSTRIDR